MHNHSTILTMDQPCEDAVKRAIDRFRLEGLSVIRTFDLQVARHAEVTCTCPHHGTELCDCQMVILLVYGGEAEPVTLIAHGYNRQTEFSVVHTPQQQADPKVEAAIRRCLPQPGMAKDA